jgi:hypothetical protein
MNRVRRTGTPQKRAGALSRPRENAPFHRLCPSASRLEESDLNSTGKFG